VANSDDKILLQTINISKTYPGGIRALDKVSFELKEGEIHALLGENGAGKTTLIKILSGISHPDEGKILYNGVEVVFKNPLDAMSLGIGVVHQHPLLIPNFNVYENLKLYATIIRQQLKIEELTNLLKIFKVEKSVLDKKIADLPSSIRQKIEILKVLLFKPKVLFLDEPTSALTPIEVEELFNILKDLKEEKKSIVFVTHKIKEALKISDRITILRRGKKIATLKIRATYKKMS
jgi:simple sugar transport system ATP-binding protein